MTSLGVLLCRHGFVGNMLNSFTGERHAYATLFVEHLLRSGIRVQFVWYDINCRWAASFRKWLQEQPLHIQQLAKDMQYPLPPFHKYAHRCGKALLGCMAMQTEGLDAEGIPKTEEAACAHDSVECQHLNSALGMVGAGRGNGEPHETFNAHIGPLGKTTMYMTPTNRMVGPCGSHSHQRHPCMLTDCRLPLPTQEAHAHQSPCPSQPAYGICMIKRVVC